MALTPRNDDAFLREVDENLRRDRALAFARRWGRIVAAAIGALLVVLAAALAWRAHVTKLAEQDSVTLAPSINDLGERRPPLDGAGLAAVAQSRRAGFRIAARLAQAAGAAQKGDAAGAASQYEAIAADASLPQPARDLATIRAVAQRFDTLPPGQVIDRLKGLAVVGNAWFGSAGELTALAWLKQGRRDRAGQIFASIARDEAVPASLRGRAAGMATMLGQVVQPATQTTPKG